MDGKRPRTSMKVDPKPRLRSRAMFRINTKERDKPRKQKKEIDMETVIEATIEITETTEITKITKVETTMITEVVTKSMSRNKILKTRAARANTRRKIMEIQQISKSQRPKAAIETEMNVVQRTIKALMIEMIRRKPNNTLVTKN